MPPVFEYLLKLSVGLILIYLFYQLVLRRLTFYNWNRWYLLCYSLLAFVIPFINITAALERNKLNENALVDVIPTIQRFTSRDIVSDAVVNEGWTKWDLLIVILCMGFLISMLRLLLVYLSFLKMTRNAELISDGETKLYQVAADIIPFSFGNSIFINQDSHTSEEMQDIIRHEFVHVKERHTIDILVSELIVALNWYNPAAWLIRRAIRQNLEFIADNKVIESGIDRKQYQYLLLKVIGNSHYSIAANFNFSSLKTRIAMMNKIKTARIHLLRFLFLAPLISILLLSFRSIVKDALKNNFPDAIAGKTQPKFTNPNVVTVAGLVIDAKTLQPIPFASIREKERGIEIKADEKGFYSLNLPNSKQPLHFTLAITQDGYHESESVENWGPVAGNFIEFLGLVKKGGKGDSFGDLYSDSKAFAEVDYNTVAQSFKVWRGIRNYYISAGKGNNDPYQEVRSKVQKQLQTDTVPSLKVDPKVDISTTPIKNNVHYEIQSNLESVVVNNNILFTGNVILHDMKNNITIKSDKIIIKVDSFKTDFHFDKVETIKLDSIKYQAPPNTSVFPSMNELLMEQATFGC